MATKKAMKKAPLAKTIPRRVLEAKKKSELKKKLAKKRKQRSYIFTFPDGRQSLQPRGGKKTCGTGGTMALVMKAMKSMKAMKAKKA